MTGQYRTDTFRIASIRRALSEALGLRIGHFSVAFEYESDLGPGCGALASCQEALVQLNPKEIHERALAQRIASGHTLTPKEAFGIPSHVVAEAIKEKSADEQ